MTRLPFMLLVLTASLNCAAADPQCDNPADTVKQLPPQNTATLARHFWESGRDSRSKGHLKTLYLFFKNGDYAVIQHRYCTTYNFNIAYFRSGQVDKLKVGDIAKTLGDLYESYAAKKATFKRPLTNLITTSLTESGFDGDKNISMGLPSGDAQYPNEHVEYSVSYTSLYMSTSIYSSVSTFYVGIGGLD